MFIEIMVDWLEDRLQWLPNPLGAWIANLVGFLVLAIIVVIAMVLILGLTHM